MQIWEGLLIWRASCSSRSCNQHRHVLSRRRVMAINTEVLRQAWQNQLCPSKPHWQILILLSSSLFHMIHLQSLPQRSANFLWIRSDSRYFRWQAIWSAFNAWEQPQIGCKWMGYIPLKRYLGILKFEFQVTISCCIILLLFFPSAT